jgi:hypothetical protein
MKRTNNGSEPTPSGCQQITAALILILFGIGACLIPLFLGLNATANIRGNRGPGGGAALILGVLCIIYGLIRLCIILVKALIKD